MGGYLLNFVVYTAAMIGVIFVAVLAYKKFSVNTSAKGGFLNIEDSMSLAPRKNLYIIRAGEERFLIASDAEHTSLISKLVDNQHQTIGLNNSSVDDLPVIVDFHKKREGGKNAQQVLKNIVNGI